MSASRPARQAPARSQRPKATTVFAAAFLAGAAAAVGLNRTLDVHLAQRQPRVESEPIFVALRTLPQGAPVTVWDVALREWPKAMLPAAAMRPRDSFEGMVLRHPLREGQPILSVQLVKAALGGDQVAEATAAHALPGPSATEPAAQQTDLWAPAEVPSPAAPPAEAVSQANPPMITSEPPAAAVRDPVAEVSQPLETLPAREMTRETLVEARQPPAEPIQTPSTAPEHVVVAEPVVAEPVVAEPVVAEPVVAEPVVAEPVVVAAPASTDIDAVTAPVATATAAAVAQSTPVVRYLVVPERIALDADRSFVPAPAEEPPPAAAPESTARSVPKQPAGAPVQVQQQRATRPVERTSSSRDRQTQRPPRSAAGQPAPTRQPAKTSLLRSMMPTMSLGMGAVEPSPATRDKAGHKPDDTAGTKTEQPTRPAFRGFGLFR